MFFFWFFNFLIFEFWFFFIDFFFGFFWGFLCVGGGVVEVIKVGGEVVLVVVMGLEVWGEEFVVEGLEVYGFGVEVVGLFEGLDWGDFFGGEVVYCGDGLVLLVGVVL